MHASLKLHQELISVADWLRIYSTLTGADGASSLRWTRGNPSLCIASTYGEVPELSLDGRQSADHIVAQSRRREPGFIEEFLPAGNPAPASVPAFFQDPRCLTAVVDWAPACIVLVMYRRQSSPAWNAADRDRIRATFPYVRDSVEVHKKLDRNRYIAGLARDLMNKSPRGILVLSDDATIQLANTRATEILTASDGISEANGKLVVHDKQVAERIHLYLRGLGTVASNSMPEMDWNMAVRKPSGGPPYQLILGCLKLEEWNLESRHSDRVAIMHLHDPGETPGVSSEQLSEFYGFTKAQARLAAKLFQGHSINEAAAALHISVNTARSHVRGIYAKTGVRTQAELLGLLSAGLTSFGQSVDD